MEKDRLPKSTLDQQLRERWPDTHIEIHQTIDSTNKLGMRLAEEGISPAIIVANKQTQGVGRYRRSFYSPAGSGVYLSVVLERPFYSDKILLFTTHTAVALCQTITHFLPYEQPEIKWVNDVYLNQKKVAGILVQAQTQPNDSKKIQLIIGVGINLYEPKDGFPAELKEKAGAIFTDAKGPSREAFVVKFLAELDKWLAIDDAEVCGSALTYYRNHQFLTNKVVTFEKKNKVFSGYVTGIADQYALVVCDQEGTNHYLTSGEVQITQFD
ncbi:MAG: biotin--[acetyl-CoA-carboxylase] ligase [Aerococcus sp.]|nr:biotin--[acetyl-CoA-carboxylase] ligase [Aerococcus sp.]